MRPLIEHFLCGRD